MTAALAPLPALPPPPDIPDVHFEYHGGKWQEKPPMGSYSGFIATILATQLNLFAIPRKLGVAVCEVLFRLAATGPARRPDVAFVSQSLWPFSIPPVEDPAVLDVIPALAVEVISPTNLADKIAVKVRQYLTHGVPLVWVVYPLSRLVYVYDSPGIARILTETDELDGGIAVPGFRLSLRELFGTPGLPA